MRSRYTAYAIKDYQYIFDTYSTRRQQTLTAEMLAESDKHAVWKRLEVLNTSNNQVEFKALYMQGGKYFSLHEKSEFVQEGQHWKYDDGQIMRDSGALDVSRNSPCPCLSGKKFKRCCG